MDESDSTIWTWLGPVIGVVLVLLILILLRWLAQGRSYRKSNRIDGKVVIVTGCNTGIGKETVLELARRGGRIYMACRNMAKCEEARDDIIAKTRNQNVFARELNLGAQQSIRNFVAGFLKEETRLDFLINNAGIMMTPLDRTAEGIEMQMGVNHVGHFLLTTLLLDALRAAAPSRVVVVSSVGHTWADANLNREDFNSEKAYNKYTAYFRSKLANVLFTRELSKRLAGTGVTVNALHPGAVKTELNRSQPIVEWIFYPLYWFFKSARQGAQTTLMVALDPDLEQVSGKYFDNCRESKESRAAQDDAAAEWLWQKSEELVAARV